MNEKQLIINYRAMIDPIAGDVWFDKNKPVVLVVDSTPESVRYIDCKHSLSEMDVRVRYPRLNWGYDHYFSPLTKSIYEFRSSIGSDWNVEKDSKYRVIVSNWTSWRIEELYKEIERISGWNELKC